MFVSPQLCVDSSELVLQKKDFNKVHLFVEIMAKYVKYFHANLTDSLKTWHFYLQCQEVVMMITEWLPYFSYLRVVYHCSERKHFSEKKPNMIYPSTLSDLHFYHLRLSFFDLRSQINVSQHVENANGSQWEDCDLPFTVLVSKHAQAILGWISLQFLCVLSLSL